MLRGKYPDPSLWLRGLGPPHVRPVTYQQRLVEEGIFQQQLVEDPSVLYATDGSPGASQDARFQVLTWGVVAFRKTDHDIEVLGRATGPVQGEQTVFRAEAAALLYVARKTKGDVDVTLDCQGVLKCLRRAPGWKSEDIFQPLREHKDRLQLTWINSHLLLEKFCEKFGPQNWWRWKARNTSRSDRSLLLWCKKVAVPQPSTKLPETTLALTVCCSLGQTFACADFD